MSENTENVTENRPFVRSVFVLLRHWRFLALSFVVAAVVAVVFALMMPNWFKSTATFLPPAGGSGLLDKVSGGLSTTLRTFGISGIGGESGGYSYLSILESRRMGERIVNEFDLIKVYDIGDGSMEKALGNLEDNTNFEFDEDGRVVISVWDTDPKRAAEMANTYFTNLNDISTELNSAEARGNREFVELQYTTVRDSLHRLEERMAAFQRRTKILSLEEQTKATIKAAGEMYAQLESYRVMLGVLERNLGKDDAEVRSLRIAISEMEKRVPGLGDNELTGMLGDNVGDISEEGITYLRLYRDIEILSKLQAFLLPMYQQSLIDEQKKMHVLVPLDVAVPAERKSRPRRSIIVLAAGLSVLFLAAAFLLIRERLRYYSAQHADEWSSVRRSIGFKRSKE
ncbi:hypothetical protein KQI65_00545 [bacterium]|nr:hypothetical protein [bacterium]